LEANGHFHAPPHFIPPGEKSLSSHGKNLETFYFIAVFTVTRYLTLLIHKYTHTHSLSLSHCNQILDVIYIYIYINGWGMFNALPCGKLRLSRDIFPSVSWFNIFVCIFHYNVPFVSPPSDSSVDWVDSLQGLLALVNFFLCPVPV
jgi:hypothetical protein